MNFCITIKVRKLFLLNGILIFVYGHASAQTLQDKIFLSYNYTPSTTQIGGSGQSNQTDRVELQIGPPPVAITSHIKWINTFYVQTQQLNLSGFDGILTPAPSSFVDLQYGSIFIFDVATRWSLFHSSRVVWRNEQGKNLFNEGFFYNGLLTANFNPDGKKKLVYSFGLALANDFNRNALIPIVGLTYYDQRFTVEVAYPRVNFLYKFKRRWELGATGVVNGGIFSIKNLGPTNSSETSYARLIDVSVGATLNYQISKKIILNNWVGYPILRKYDLLNREFEKKEAAGFDLEGSISFKTGIGIRL